MIFLGIFCMYFVSVTCYLLSNKIVKQCVNCYTLILFNSANDIIIKLQFLNLLRIMPDICEN